MAQDKNRIRKTYSFFRPPPILASGGGGGGGGGGGCCTPELWFSTTDDAAYTTGSVLIRGADATDAAQDYGTDIWFFVSGSIAGNGSERKVSAFGGDVIVSGSLTAFNGLSGSLTQLPDGTSYLIAGIGIDIVSASNGAVTISTKIGGGDVYTDDFVDGDLNLSNILVVNHNLQAQYVNVSVYDENDKLIIPDEVIATSPGTVEIDLTSFRTLPGTWHVFVASGQAPGYEQYWFSTTAGSIFTSGSAALVGDGDEWGVIDSPSDKGADVFFYVSGSISGTGVEDKKSLFGGDVVISGSLKVGTGSITITSNDVQWSGYTTRIEKSGNDMKFYDVNVPAGATLSSLIGGGSTPASPVNSVQYNDAGAFGGSANFTYDSKLRLSGSFEHGDNSKASGFFSHAEGDSTVATGGYSHAEGIGTTASGDNSHAEGEGNESAGWASHAEGLYSLAASDYSHVEGYFTTASALYSHAEGRETFAGASYSHAEGRQTRTSGLGAHAEGWRTWASSDYSHAEGLLTTASVSYSHAEGRETHAAAAGSHAEGYLTKAFSLYSHAEGYFTTASALYSHAEGYASRTEGGFSHAEGFGSLTIGFGSHAEGGATVASGAYSHAGGIATIAPVTGSTVVGLYNIKIPSETSIVPTPANWYPTFTIGNGTSDSARSDLLRAYQDRVEVTGSFMAMQGHYAGNRDVVTTTLATMSADTHYTIIDLRTGGVYVPDGLHDGQLKHIIIKDPVVPPGVAIGPTAGNFYLFNQITFSTTDVATGGGAVTLMWMADANGDTSGGSGAWVLMSYRPTTATVT